MTVKVDTQNYELAKFNLASFKENTTDLLTAKNKYSLYYRFKTDLNHGPWSCQGPILFSFMFHPSEKEQEVKKLYNNLKNSIDLNIGIGFGGNMDKIEFIEIMTVCVETTSFF